MPGQMISRRDAETLIDEQVSKEIIEGAIKSSKAMSMFRRLPNMTSNKTKMRVLDALPLVYWQGSDNARKQLTKMAWDKKYIVAEEMAVIVPIPENVLDDADYDIWGEIKPRIQEAMGKKFDEAVFTGADKPAGFRADLLTSALNVGATVKPAESMYLSIDKAMSFVEESGYLPTGILGGMNVKSAFRTMLDNNGQPIKGTEIDGLSRAYVDNGAWDKSKAQMLVGDFSQAVYAIRQDITFKVLDQAVIQDPATGEILYNLAQDDMVALRVTARLGWEVPNPINSLQPDEAVRFPFAVILPGEYSEDRVKITFTVKDTETKVLEGAKINFNGLIKHTTAQGKAEFYANKKSNGLYRVTHQDMIREEIGEIDIDSTAVTKDITLSIKKNNSVVPDPEITEVKITPVAELKGTIEIGTKVADVSATGGTEPISYEVETGKTSFEISGTDVKAKEQLTGPTNKSLSVKATDSKGKTKTASTTINVTAQD